MFAACEQIIFVDPASISPFPITTTCENYLYHGGPFETTVLRAPKGLIGLVLIIMGAGLLVFLLICRRKPRKKRVLPLQPFNITPLYVIILGVLLAIFILALDAGDDWVRESVTDQTGRDSALTDDLDELLDAGLWTLFMLALLVGVLNQRSMAANAAMEVPFGGVSIFALIWAGLGLGTAVLAGVFSWPLFDCENFVSSNQLTCGDGSRIDVRWNRCVSLSHFLIICAKRTPSPSPNHSFHGVDVQVFRMPNMGAERREHTLRFFRSVAGAFCRAPEGAWKSVCRNTGGESGQIGRRHTGTGGARPFAPPERRCVDARGRGGVLRFKRDHQEEWPAVDVASNGEWCRSGCGRCVWGGRREATTCV